MLMFILSGAAACIPLSCLCLYLVRAVCALRADPGAMLGCLHEGGDSGGGRFVVLLQLPSAQERGNEDRPVENAWRAGEIFSFLHVLILGTRYAGNTGLRVIPHVLVRELHLLVHQNKVLMKVPHVLVRHRPSPHNKKIVPGTRYVHAFGVYILLVLDIVFNTALPLQYHFVGYSSARVPCESPAQCEFKKD